MLHLLNRLAKAVAFHCGRFSKLALLPLAKDRSAAVSVMFATSLIALVPAIGIAVDYARIVQFKSALQNAADNAALAGASAYTDATKQATATAVATTYMAKGVALLPTNKGVTTPAPTAAMLTSGGVTTGYTVQVTATGSIQTIFMSAVMSSMTASVSATAENPIQKVTINKLNPSSDAGDNNIIYMYAVPLDNSIPRQSDMTFVYNNDPAQAANNPTTVTINVPASQNVGFALKNVTGALHPYGSNGYGGAQGSTHWMYSHLKPPSKQAYPSVSNNCLIETKDISSNVNFTGNAPSGGSCFSTTPGTYTQNLALDCTKNAGKVIRYYWNDMGGPSDDHDYNDAAYSVTCPGGSSTGPQGVALIQ